MAECISAAPTSICSPVPVVTAVDTPETEVIIVHELPVPDEPQIECVVSSGEFTTVDAPVPTDSATSTSAESPTKATPHKQNPRRSFTTEFKLECVEHAERTKNKTETARVFDVNRRRVQEWCMQKEKLMAIPKEQKRLSGGGRRQIKVADVLTRVTELGSDLLFAVPPRPDKTNSESVDGEVIGGSVSGTNHVPMATLVSAVGEVPQVLSLHGSDTATPDTVIDSVVRGLSLTDPSLLPPSMVKMIQDLSSEVTSHNTSTSVESMVQDPSMEMLLNKDMDAQPSVEHMMVEIASTRDPCQAIEDTSTDTAALLGVPIQQDAVVAAPSVKAGDADYSAIASITEQVLTAGLLQQLGGKLEPALVALLHDAAALGQTPIDVSAAVLDALMQIATSVQVTSSDSSYSTSVPITSMSTSQQSVEMDPTEECPVVTPVAMEIDPAMINPDLVEAGEVPTSTGQQLAAPNDTLTEETVVSGDSKKTSPSTITRPRRSRVKKYYTLDFKLECVAHAESTSKCAAARHFDVDRRRVQDWCSQKEKLQQLRLAAAGPKKPKDSDIEKQLVRWVRKKLAAGKSLTRRMVGEEAVKLYRENGNTTFSASIGWVAKFMIRNEISLVSASPSQGQQQTVPPPDTSIQATTKDL